MNILIVTGLLCSFVLVGDGWRAVPANTAMYAMQASRLGIPMPKKAERAPRTYLHSIYKFGHCTSDMISPSFLRKRTNMTVRTWREAKYSHYVYLLEDRHTQQVELQCVVMKIFVPMQYVFFRGRVPMYYCQGQAHVLMLNTIKKVEIHEFYIHIAFGLLARFEFEFYHPKKSLYM